MSSDEQGRGKGGRTDRAGRRERTPSIVSRGGEGDKKEEREGGQYRWLGYGREEEGCERREVGRGRR